MIKEKTPKKNKKFLCEKCRFSCSNKKDYNRHLMTLKHQKTTNTNQKPLKNPSTYECNCGKIYKHLSSLSNHKVKCNYKEKTDDFLLSLKKENEDLKKIMMEILKNGTHNTTNNNNTFNMQFFLNETCKDAMNLTDFAEYVRPQLIDLEHIGQVGYIEGISSIIMKNLNELEITRRPMHCSDIQKEIVYVKDEDKWEKEDDRKEKLRNTVREVANKNIKLLSEYAEKYPNCKEVESNRNEEYLNILLEVMGGIGETKKEQEEKIIKNLVKEIQIEN